MTFTPGTSEDLKNLLCSPSQLRLLREDPFQREQKLSLWDYQLPVPPPCPLSLPQISPLLSSFVGWLHTRQGEFHIP